MKQIIVDKLPKCDFCDSLAAYDARTVLSGLWANMCPYHYKHYAADKTLGLGKGQKLILKGEK
jgi:hypothetical protein